MSAPDKTPDAEAIQQLAIEADIPTSVAQAFEATVNSSEGDLESLAKDLRAVVEVDLFQAEAGCADAAARARAIAEGSLAGAAPTGLPEEQAAPAPEAMVRDIGPYKILALLGQGGMAAVYKALHPRLDKIVALKVLATGRLKSTQAISRFDREMKAVGKLDQPPFDPGLTVHNSPRKESRVIGFCKSH